MDEHKCKRCGNEPLKDVFCKSCGKCVMANVDEGLITADETGIVIVDDGAGEHRGKLKCECGGDKFNVSYQDYCSWCEHQMGKDD
jgi:hypothetical protein